MKFSWQFESYKIEKASSSTSCKRLEKHHIEDNLYVLFFSYKWLQIEHGIVPIVDPGKWSSIEADGTKDDIFQDSQHISFSLFMGGLHEPIHLILNTVHGTSVIIPLLWEGAQRG